MANEDLLNSIPLDDLAAKLGVSREQAAQAVEEGGAAVLNGLAKNSSTPEGAAALEAALKKHEGKLRVTSIDEVDQEDGGKIVNHVFGGQASDVAHSLNASEKTSSGIDFGKLLPIIAPIVMGLIANKNSGGQSGGLGGIIGGLLGGSSTGGATGGIGSVIGDVLGGLFGKK